MLSLLFAPTTYSLYRKEVSSSKVKIKSLSDRDLVHLDVKRYRIYGSPSQPTFQFKLKLSTGDNFNSTPLILSYDDNQHPSQYNYYNGHLKNKTLFISETYSFYTLLSIREFHFDSHVLNGYAKSTEVVTNPYHTSRWNFISVIKMYHRLKDDIDDNKIHYTSSRSSAGPFFASLLPMTAHAAELDESIVTTPQVLELDTESDKKKDSKADIEEINPTRRNDIKNEGAQSNSESQTPKNDADQSPEPDTNPVESALTGHSLTEVKALDQSLTESEAKEAADLLAALPADEAQLVKEIFLQGKEEQSH